MLSPLSADYLERKDHLHVPVQGTFDLASAVRIFEKIFDACRVYGTNKVLLDTRHMEGRISATERIVQGLSLEKPYNEYRMAGGEALQLAIYSSEDRLTPYHPLADTLSQLDLRTDAFTDPEAVVSWLGIERIDETGVPTGSP